MRKSCRARMCAGRRKEYSLRLGTGGSRPQGVGNMHFRGWLYATHQTLPTLPSTARVSVQGLWIALLRPDIEHKPSEWGRVVVVSPFATNRGRLLAVAKLDGVIDYPNCRSRGSPQTAFRFAYSRVTVILLTLILYHT